MPTDVSADSPALTADDVLGELLVRSGTLSARDLDRYVQAREELGGALSDILPQLGLVAESDVVQARAGLLGIPMVRAEGFPAAPVEVEGLQAGFLSAHRVFPFAREEQALLVAMAEPADAF